MSSLVRSVRHIQVKQISYCPKIFQAIIDYTPHPTEFDESDDLEYQKNIINKLVEDKWFIKTPRVVPCIAPIYGRYISRRRTYHS
jgi:hypothetical protein